MIPNMVLVNLIVLTHRLRPSNVKVIHNYCVIKKFRKCFDFKEKDEEGSCMSTTLETFLLAWYLDL
ncbi:CLUMA_CG016728, isoform A [Clunio marinus]|uniref:CLUMA_CG016728, isoform A n=1 Tax=Clunio marinus TaxID=568069 RepID=A0A1J1IVX4_9DIPT|nr:CLUMA_CG016728, isoform A [Clunio marinus]